MLTPCQAVVTFLTHLSPASLPPTLVPPWQFNQRRSVTLSVVWYAFSHAHGTRCYLRMLGWQPTSLRTFDVCYMCVSRTLPATGYNGRELKVCSSSERRDFINAFATANIFLSGLCPLEKCVLTIYHFTWNYAACYHSVRDDANAKDWVTLSILSRAISYASDNFSSTINLYRMSIQDLRRNQWSRHFFFSAPDFNFLNR